MRTTITACLAAVTLVLTACGSSDGGSGEASGDQGEVADLVMTAAGDEGLVLDADCVNDAVGELSDADAKALVDAGLDGDADISEEGEAIGDKIFSDCVDAESYLDALVTSFAEDDPTLDADCLRSALEGKTVAEIDEELFDAASDCTTDG